MTNERVELTPALEVDVQTWDGHPEGQRVFVSNEPFQSVGLTPTEMDALTAWWSARRAEGK